MPVRFSSIPLSIILTLSAVFLPLPSFSADQCSQVFLAPTAPLRYGQIRPDFVGNDHYTVETENQSRIENQCDLGVCHLESWIGELEKGYKDRTGKTLKLSPHYLLATYWMNAAQQVIMDPSSDPKDATIELGAMPSQSRDFINAIGLIPDVAWKGHRDIQNGPQVTKMTEYLENIIVRTKAAIAANPAKKAELQKQGAQEIQDAFINFLGISFPEKFTYRGKEYTPLSFKEKFFPELKRPIISMYINPDRTQKQALISADKTEVVGTIDQVEQITKALLDKGLNVYLAYDHHFSFTDDKTGLMSISAFYFPHEGAPLTRQQRDTYNTDTGGGHAVQIVGYDLDPATGKIIKWKIKNSWGRKVGVKGYYNMYNDFFREFAQGIVFYQDSGVTLPANMGLLPADEE